MSCQSRTDITARNRIIPNPSRHTWLGLLTVVSILSIACGAGGDETTERKFEVGASSRLVVGAGHGDVLVQIGPVGMITVLSVVTNRDNVDLDITAEAAVVTVKSITRQSRNLFGDSAQGAVDSTFTVPPETAIEVGIANGTVSVDGIQAGGVITAGNGIVTLRNVTGDFSGGVGSGDVGISGGSGSFRFTTGAGSIRFEGDLVTGGSNRFETGTGDVIVAISRDASVELDATVARGSLSSELSLTGETSTRSGTGRSLSGTLGDGGADLVITVGTGSVEISDRPLPNR